MKKQLRGRFRRNVATLLEAGMEVAVVAVQSRDDFHVGLEHPHLTVELVTPQTLYTRHVHRVRRHRARRAAVARLRLGRERRAMVRAVVTGGGTLREALAVLREQRRYRVAGAVVRPFAAWMVPLLVPGLVVLRTARQLGRLGRPAPAPAPRGSGRGGPHRHPRAERWVRSAYRAVRRRVWWPLRRSASRARDRFDDATTAALLPLARVLGFWSFWRQSAAFVRRVQPDLVVTSDLPGLVGAARAARRLHIPHVHDCHELFLESTSLRWYEKTTLRPLERRHMRAAARVVAVNGSIAREYGRRYGVRPVVVRNCADAPATLHVRDLREVAGIPPESSVVLYQGGLTPGRGLDVCVAAMQDLPDAHLIMLGYGPLRQPLEEQAAELGLAERVHLLPAVLPQDLLAYTASASVGVIPYQPVSMNNYLTLPNKIFEYTSVGLPLVTSDLPELREIVVGHGCGLVYDPYDPRSLARALEQVLDPEAAVAFRGASQRFGEENTWQREQQLLLRSFLEPMGIPEQRGDGTLGAVPAAAAAYREG